MEPSDAHDRPTGGGSAATDRGIGTDAATGSARAAPGVQWSSVLTFAAAVGPAVALVAREPDLLRGARVPIALAAALGFGALFWTRRVGPRIAAALLAALATAAIAALPFPLANAPTLVLLQVMVAARLAHLDTPPLAWTVLGLQWAALLPIYAPIIGGPSYLLAFVGAVGGLELFAYHVARLHVREAATSAALRRTLASLDVAQAVLARDERLGERVRIARDLHDAVGHHLTTLSLQLDLARRQPPDAARATLDTAHSICRLLLAELRDVLEDVRQTDGAGLEAALRAMVARVPELDVRLETEGDLGALDPDRAHALLRCAQELLTNALRHADADRLALRLSVTGEGRDRRVVLGSEDDGRGLRAPRGGGGLEGIGARVRALGGSLRILERPGGRGVRFEAELPLPEVGP